MRMSGRGSEGAVMLAAALACGACSGPGHAPVVEEALGELGNGTFRWQCVGLDEDPTCGTGSFPAAVALGSRFDLSFSGGPRLPDDVNVFEVEAVSPTRLARSDDDFAAIESGHVSVLARGDGYGVDFIELDVLPVDTLEIYEFEEAEPCNDLYGDGECDTPQQGSSERDVALVVDRSTKVRARPYHSGVELAGALSYTWENLTPERLELSRVRGGEATFRARDVGTVLVRVTAGEFTQSLTFDVSEAPEPEPEPEPEGTTGGPDTGSDSSSESGSDSGSESGTGFGSESGSDSGGSTTGGMR